MRLRIAYQTSPDQAEQEFVTSLYCCVAWEASCNRKITDGRGFGYEDLAFFTYAHLQQAGQIKVNHAELGANRARFMQWMLDNPGLAVRFVKDETDANPTDGAPTDDN